MSICTPYTLMHHRLRCLCTRIPHTQHSRTHAVTRLCTHALSICTHLRGLDRMESNILARLRVYHGGSPVSISNTSMPRDHQSTATPCPLPSIICNYVLMSVACPETSTFIFMSRLMCFFCTFGLLYTLDYYTLEEVLIHKVDQRYDAIN